ncbi:hypothetical protein [Streptomyces sp. MK5]|uniref:hypothetical protein n=1 Tax=Streptomyces sp. MK5 TaxID=3064253 RepID=UPI0027415AF8|nr:hypothetical protein [Streptomyces sp. MK5]
MSSITDFASLRRAMTENGEAPEGPARNARAEQLLAEAEKLGIPLAVIEALGHQVNYPPLKRWACTTGATGCGTAFAPSPDPLARGRGR